MRQTWEYKVISVDPTGSKTDDLNELGADGWELVTVTLWNSWLFYFLKRPN